MKTLTHVLLTTALFVTGLVGRVSAQPIQGHPQKAAYASSAEYPPLNNQCWFDDADPLKAGHVHLILRPAVFSIVRDWNTTEVALTLQLHNVSGGTNIIGERVQSVRWDLGDIVLRGGGPNSLVEYTGVATINHTLPDPAWDFLSLFKFPLHGWADDRITAITYLDDGRRLDTYGEWAVYSLIDPNAPEHPSPEQGRPGVHLRTRCVMWSNNPLETAGEIITEISDYIPLTTITAPWTTIANVYNYTAPADIIFPAEVFELRKDSDLHHGVLGPLVRRVETAPGARKEFFGPMTLDPADWGTGSHKAMVIWTQPLFNGTALSSVLAFPLTVGVGVPVPTTCTDPAALNPGGLLPCRYPTPVLLCQDPKATNVGQPLPCVYPPPPPVETFDIFAPVFRVSSKDANLVLMCKTAAQDPATCPVVQLGAR